LIESIMQVLIKPKIALSKETVVQAAKQDSGSKFFGLFGGQETASYETEDESGGLLKYLILGAGIAAVATYSYMKYKPA
jgi:hypothetical protein